MELQWQELPLKINFSTVSKFPKHRVQKAKEKLRKILSYENLKRKTKYRNLTKEQYFVLINNLEKISFLILETYFSGNNERI